MACAWPTFVDAQEPGSLYLQLDGGASLFDDTDVNGNNDAITYDDGWAGGLRIGYRLSNIFRIEGDVSGSYNEVDEVADVDLDDINADVELYTLTFGAGLYADLIRIGNLITYVGAGGGGAYREFDQDFTGADDDTELYAHAEGGISIELSPHFALVPHYRLVWYDEFGDDDQLAHWIRLGLRFSS